TVDRGQDLLERLVRAEPRMASLKSELAAGCRQAGHIYRDSGKLGEALAQYNKGLALMEELARLYPEVPNYRNDLAKCHFDRAAQKWPADGANPKGHPADLALGVLREAVAAGFRDGARLQSDPAFAVLRERAEFTELVAGLATGDGSR